MMTERRMPILHDTEIKSIPWATISKYEDQAKVNHGRSLGQIAISGGLTPEEAIAIIEQRPWMRMPFTEARERLAQYVRGAEVPAITTSGTESVKIPTSYQEAAAMWLIGEKYIRDNHPEKIKPVGHPNKFFVGERRQMFIPETVGDIGDEFDRDGNRWRLVSETSRDGEVAMCEVIA